MDLHGVARNLDTSLWQVIILLSAAQNIKESKSKYFDLVASSSLVSQREQCSGKTSDCLAT